jgi:hypothetical protein
MASDTSASTLKAFLFNSRATALRGSVRKPYYQELGEHAPLRTYAGSSGQGSSEFKNFSLANTVSYKAASSQISADVEGSAPKRVFRTRVESTLEGLSVLGGRIKADLVVSALETVFDERFFSKEKAPLISPAGSRFENLVIDGQIQKPVLPPAFTASRDDVESYFKRSLKDPSRFTPAITAEPFHKDGLGTIYFAEWVFINPYEKYRQALIMLRLALGSDDGLDMDCCLTESDGTGVDP